MALTNDELRQMRREQMVIYASLTSGGFFLAVLIMFYLVKYEQIIVQHRYVCVAQSEKLSFGPGMLWCDKMARAGVRFNDGERIPIPEEYR